MKRELTEFEIDFIDSIIEKNGAVPHLGGEVVLGFDINKGFFIFDRRLEINQLEYIDKIDGFSKTVQDIVSQEMPEHIRREVKVDSDFIGLLRSKIQRSKIIFDPNKGTVFKELSYIFINTFSTTNTLLGIREEVKERIRTKQINYNQGLKFLDNLIFTKILLKNICNGDEDCMEYLINWLSCAINRREKNRTAIAFVGATQGTGKGVFETFFLKKMYSNYMTTLSNAELESDFNASMDEKLFVVMNEIKANLKDSSRVAEKLKMLITDDTIQIRKMRQDFRAKKSYFNMVLFSNEALPVKIAMEDRRWTVIETSSSKLIDIAKKIGMTIHEFLGELEKEVVPFWMNVMAYDYNLQRAAIPLDTDLKNTIAESTSSKREIVLKKVIHKDADWIISRLEDAVSNNYFTIEGEMLSSETLNLKLEDDFSKNRISNKLVFYIYEHLIDEEEKSKNKISSAIKTMLGDSFVSNGMRFRNIKTGVKIESILEDVPDEFIKPYSVEDEEFTSEAKASIVKRIDFVSFSEAVKINLENIKNVSGIDKFFITSIKDSKGVDCFSFKSHRDGVTYETEELDRSECVIFPDIKEAYEVIDNCFIPF